MYDSKKIALISIYYSIITHQFYMPSAKNVPLIDRYYAFLYNKIQTEKKKNILINVLFRPLVAFRWLSVTLFFFLSICFRFNSCQFQCDSKWNLNKHSTYHFHNESCAKSDIVLHFVIEWNSPAGISSELKLKLKFLWNRSRNWNWN